MASQFNQETIDQINSIHLQLFDTYKRDVQFTFYMTAKEVVVEDPNYDYEFDYLDTQKNELITQSASFDVCLTYLKRQEFADFIKGSDSNLRFKATQNRIRIQVKEEAFQYLKDGLYQLEADLASLVKDLTKISD